MRITEAQLRKIIRETVNEWETGDPARDLSGRERAEYERLAVSRAAARAGYVETERRRPETENEKNARLKRQAREFEDSARLARLGDAAIERRDAEWRRGEPARVDAASKAASAEAAERKERTIAAIKAYGEEYKSAKDLPLFSMLDSIFVPGVRLKASEAIKKSSEDLYLSLKNKSWEDALEFLRREM